MKILIKPVVCFRWSLSMMTFLMVLEVCGQIDDYLSYRVPLFSPYSIDNLYMYDEIGKIGAPFGHYEKWKLNSLGYRGPELVANTVSLITIGASETFGQQESEDCEYPRQLEYELNRRSKQTKYQVVNVALPGMSLNTAISRIPEISKRVNPAFAFVYVVPAKYIEKSLVIPYRSRKAIEPAVLDVTRLRMLRKSYATLKSVIPMNLQTILWKWEIRFGAAKLDRVMATVPESHLNQLREDEIQMASVLRHYGIKPVFLTHVTRFGGDFNSGDYSELIRWRKFYPMLEEEGFLDLEMRANAVTRNVASELNLCLIDAATLMPFGSKYFSDFVHFTDEGAHRMAQIIVDGLLLRDCLSSADRGNMTELVNSK